MMPHRHKWMRLTADVPSAANIFLRLFDAVCRVRSCRALAEGSRWSAYNRPKYDIRYGQDGQPVRLDEKTHAEAVSN
ncbi:MAG: hypothetical protein J4F28_02045 [Nitrosopumilaceae archaeon]|nr:hypothetical protein [Nitrosopumilaceae archaeon]